MIIAALSLGFIRIVLTKDSEYLYCPVNGRARYERKVAESLFPPDKNDFDITRMMRFGRIGLLLMEAKDGGSILREEIIEEIRNLNEIIENISIIYENRTLKYKDICMRTYNGKCVENMVLSLAGKVEDIKNKKFPIRFPFEITESSNIPVFSIVNFGGVTTDENNIIEDAKAIRLMYLMRYDSEELNEISLKWEEEFLETVSRVNSPYLNLYKFVGSTFDTEFHRMIELILPYIIMAVPLMLTFAVITSMTKDWVTSKPWIGVSGCLSPALGGFGAFGFLLLCGAEYIDLSLSIFFLLIGIGLDDSFVLLAAWRRTYNKDTVEKRISDAYSEAAVSITLTSVTNFLSFCIGMTTPYRVVQIYSLYACTSIIFAYFLQITFFGGILALSGFREKNNMHSLLCIGVNMKKTYSRKIYQVLKVGLVNKDSTFNSSDVFIKFYRDIIGEILIKPQVKFLVAILFVVYISGAIFSLRYLKQGFDYRNGFPYSSYAVNFTTKHYQYFVEYPHGVQIIINKTLDYSDPEVQKDVTEIINKFANAPNMAGENIVDSWLKYYINSLNNSNLWLSYRGYDMTKSEDFIEGLRNIFLKFPNSHRFKKDIIFNENHTQIVASRFLVASKYINDSSMERELLIRLWNIADSCKYPVFVHNYWFLILNQHINIEESSIQTLCIASVMVTMMFLIFLPDAVCASCIAVTIASIQIGIIGYMSLWSVNLDTISMLILIMSTGLSIDYAAHISYAYITSKEKDPNEKIKKSLEAAGHPIFQGCVSTVLGVAVLACGPSYSFVIFFKIISLAMFFSFLHGIFLLPVFLNIWESFSLYMCKRKSSENDNAKSDIEHKEIKTLIINGLNIDEKEIKFCEE